jgi:hypothetical protein
MDAPPQGVYPTSTSTSMSMSMLLPLERSTAIDAIAAAGRTGGPAAGADRARPEGIAVPPHVGVQFGGIIVTCDTGQEWEGHGAPGDEAEDDDDEVFGHLRILNDKTTKPQLHKTTTAPKPQLHRSTTA